MGIITVTLNSGCHTEQDSAFMMTLSILNESLPFRTDHCHSERSEESGSHYQYEQNRNMIIKELNGKVPSTGEGTFIAENAALIGDVVTGRNCSIWYGAVLRGDVGPIKLGDNVNIQDCAVLHATTDFSEVVIGNNVSVGHNAIVHGARIGNDVLIGMGAIVMDNAVIPDGTVIAAGAVVLENKVLEPGIWAGIPAKKVKDASDRITSMAHDNAMHYIEYKEWYK